MVGVLMTPPKDKIKKDNGELGDTCIKGLMQVYALERYGRERKLDAPQIRKGLGVEQESIDLINLLLETKYQKNEERITNEFWSGIPDMYEGKNILKAKSVRDAKSCWDIHSFLINEIEDPKKIWYWQIQSYLDLCNSPVGYLDMTLINAPAVILLEEQRKLMWKMGVATEDNPDYKQAAAEKEFDLTFNDIPKEERHIPLEIVRNDEDILRARKQAVKWREWLAEFDDKRMSRYGS